MSGDAGLATQNEPWLDLNNFSLANAGMSLG